MEASLLNKTLEQHKLWVDGKGGKRALLEGANLGGADLEVADLRRADLNGANLYSANLEGANLRDANLNGANLYSANLEGANLRDANLKDANLRGANLTGANLSYADLRGANLDDANLTDAILPDISWIIPGCLVQLNNIMYGLFYLKKENKFENFIQDSLGFFIQNNPIEKTFDMLAGDRIIRNIPDWVKYTGLKKIESV